MPALGRSRRSLPRLACMSHRIFSLAAPLPHAAVKHDPRRVRQRYCRPVPHPQHPVSREEAEAASQAGAPAAGTASVAAGGAASVSQAASSSAAVEEDKGAGRGEDAHAGKREAEAAAKKKK